MVYTKRSFDLLCRMEQGKERPFAVKRIRKYGKKVKAYNQQLENALKGILFSSVADTWWNEVEPTLEHNTISSYRPAYRRAKDEFGDRLVSDITAKEIDSYIRRFSASRSRKTVVTQLQIIRQILRKAEVDGYISYNPASAVRPPRNLPQSRRKAPDKHQIELVKNSVGHKLGCLRSLYTIQDAGAVRPLH